MPFSCEFSTAFSSAFAICDTDEATPDTRTLRGVPAPIPRIRKRPDVAEISGTGIIPVIGVGKLAGEAALSGRLNQAVDLTGGLVTESFRILVAAIASGAEAAIVGEWLPRAECVIGVGQRGRMACDLALTVQSAIIPQAVGAMGREQMAGARMSIRHGAEAHATRYENEESILLAAAMLLTRWMRRA